MKNTTKIIAGTCLAIVLLEVLLRLLAINQTYTESIGMGYSSYFGKVTDNIYNTYKPNDTFLYDHGDYKYTYTTNELGLRERQLTAFSDSPHYRIIALGDSYTEGAGTAYDSTWPRFLEQKTRMSRPAAQVYDAGLSGDDPFFEYVLYRDKLSLCHADLVIVAINSTDIDDYFFRGGMERFHPDGHVVNRKGPWYEFLYRHSYIARFISVSIFRQRQQMFATDAQYAVMERRFIHDAADVLDSMQQIARERKLLVVIHPQPTECAFADHPVNIHAHNVLTQLIDSLHHRGIAATDLYPSLHAAITESNWMQYTYQHDRHFNSKGYALFTDKLYDQVSRDYPGLVER